VSVKMELARKLLRENRLTIEEFSESLGYSCRHKFEETFKKKVGVTPAQYRRLAAQGIDPQ